MPKNDSNSKAIKRYVDQPGQWRDTTPKSVKQRQEKAWNEFNAMMAKSQRGKKK